MANQRDHEAEIDRLYELPLDDFTTARDALEDGPADGPGVHPDTSLREVLAELVWTGTAALPVSDESTRLGRVTLDGVVARGRGR